LASPFLLAACCRYFGLNLGTYTSADYVINAIAWSPDGRYLAAGGDNESVQVWRLGNSDSLYTYTNHTDTVRAVAWSPDSQRIASASNDSTVQIWDALTGDNEVTYQQP
jgi:WD40 repeat protein